MDKRLLYQSMNFARTSEQLQPFIAYLREELETKRDLLLTLTDPALIHVTQGKALMLREVLTLIEDSSRLLGKVVK